VDRATVNQRAAVACRAAGEGCFIRALRNELRRRRVDVPFVEYDLIAEMRGASQPQLLAALGAALASPAPASPSSPRRSPG
jgi:hypothetical protein